MNVDRNPVSDRNSSQSARKPNSFYTVLTQTQFTGGQVEHTVVTLPAKAFRARGVGRGGFGWGPMGRIVGQCHGAHAGSASGGDRQLEMDASGMKLFGPRRKPAAEASRRADALASRL